MPKSNSKSLVPWFAWTRNREFLIKAGLVMLVMLLAVVAGFVGSKFHHFPGGGKEVGNSNHVALTSVVSRSSNDDVEKSFSGWQKQCLPVEMVKFDSFGMVFGNGNRVSEEAWCHFHRALEEIIKTSVSEEEQKISISFPMFGMVDGNMRIVMGSVSADRCFNQLGRVYDPVMTPACNHFVRVVKGWDGEQYSPLGVTPCDFNRLIPLHRLPEGEECL